MPQTKHNVTLDDLYVMLQEMNRRLITVEASVVAKATNKPHEAAPARQLASAPAVESSKGGSSAEWEETLAVLKRAQGAWAANPWENYMEDIRAMREEWDHRDFWNPDPAKRHRD
jgi:predicted RecB family endonuclease